MSIWLVITVIVIVSFLFIKPKAISEPTTNLNKSKISQPPSQSASLNNSPNSTVYQANRDIIVNPIEKESKIKKSKVIQSIMLEARLTCDLKEGAELPPAEVPYLPMSGADCFLEGPPGKVRLDFVSPVRFRRQDDNNMVIINRFSLPNGSDLFGRPLEVLKGYKGVSIAIQTIVWGKSFKTMKFVEASMSINGEDMWYYHYDVNNVPFLEGPVFALPLDSLHQRI